MSIALLVLLVAGGIAAPPLVRSTALPGDVDDPAIWRNQKTPAASLVVVTIKEPAPNGGIAVLDLDGKTVQLVLGLDRPNNVDIEAGVLLGRRQVDLVAVTERYARGVRLYSIGPSGVAEITKQALPVFEGEPFEHGQPMGIAFYRRPSDRAVFLFVSRSAGPLSGYVWQYRLDADIEGKPTLTKVREIGEAGPGQEIEALAVDDARSRVYLAEEKVAIHVWRADPEHQGPSGLLGRLGATGFQGDREGVGLGRYRGGDAVFATDQIVGGSRMFVFSAEAKDGEAPLAVLNLESDETDGIDIMGGSFGPRFPRGLFVAMNSVGRNFFFYRLDMLSGAP